MRRTLEAGGALALVSITLAALTAAPGCGGDSTTSTTSTTTGTGGSTGTTTAATTGTGGSGTGGMGGSGPTCLDAASLAGLFTIAQPSLCAVAIYEADEMIVQSFQTPSWGSHGGPLTLRPGDSGAVELERWTVPAGASGKLTKAETHVDAKIPDGAFAGSAVLDLPFFGWTALTWTGAFPDTKGEVILVKNDGTVDKRYDANGTYAFGAVLASPDHGRFFMTGLSPIGDGVGGTNGLYAADSCGTAAMPSLLPGADATCAKPIEVASWGDSSGPITVDGAGNVIAVMSSFSGDQEARAFANGVIVPGAAPADGDTLFTLPGFGSALAALSPTATQKGLVAFQPIDGMTFTALDIVGQSYSVAGGKVTADGVPAPLLTLAVAKTSVTMMNDDQERIWVALPSATGTTFVVLARTP